MASVAPVFCIFLAAWAPSQQRGALCFLQQMANLRVSSLCWTSQPPPWSTRKRIGGLVIVHRKREGHEQRGRTHGCDFGHGAGTRAADHQVGSANA
jgi:hypothetical protein